MLREGAVTVTKNQKVAYVVDVRDIRSNGRRITELARDADTMLIEATFAKADADRAADRNQLTTEQAGQIARNANAELVVPFHFSPSYTGKGVWLEREAQETFRGGAAG